jgi:hypothetical protein
MKQTLNDIKAYALAALQRKGHAAIAERAAEDCMWLEAVAYPGLKILAEALADEAHAATLEKDLMGLDLQNISCVFLADAVHNQILEHGRLFLRNVRHGLYLLPQSVHANYGIGCPVDPGFPLGGERSKNPYAEKFELAQRDGVEVDDAVWQALAT